MVSRYSSLSDYCLGELYSARIVNRSIGCSHPGTWCILVSDQSSSCLYQFSHCLFYDGITQGVTRIRDCYSVRLCWKPCLRCLTHFSRCPELHRGLPTRNIPCSITFSMDVVNAACSDRSLYSCLKRSIS